MDCVLLYGNSGLPGILRPAGPARITTELRNYGFDAISIDIGAIHRTRFDLVERLLRKFITKKTLWIGLSTTFMPDFFGINFPRLDQLKDDSNIEEGDLPKFVEICKDINPNIKFILGGSYSLNLSKFNFYTFRGYADKEIVEFTKWCKNSNYHPKIKRLGKIIECDEFEHFIGSRIDWQRYDGIEENDTLPIEISRGCIFKCKFCAYPLNGKSKGQWVKHFDILRDEFIKNYEKWGTTKYIFSDDTYNDSPDKVIDLYENVYSKLPFQIDISCYIRLDLVYRFKHTAQVLAESGIKSYMLGIETNNEKSAVAIGKGLSFNKQIEYLKTLKENEWKHGLAASGFITGLPYDTKESINELVNFLLSKNNPLDEWIIRPLGLNPLQKSAHKKFFSAFDLEYEKYGYEIVNLNSTDNIYKMNWDLKSQNLNSQYCTEICNNVMNLSEDLDNFKYAGQNYGRISSLITPAEVIQLSRKQILSKYNIENLTEEKIKRYYKNLFNY